MNANQHQSSMLPYPLMAIWLAVAIIVPMTIAAVVLGMTSNPWYWLLMGSTACGSQVSLIVAYRLNDSAARRQR